MSRIDAAEYLQKCQQNCSDRITDPALFSDDTRQQNSLRVETLRDTSPRCGQMPPEHWHEDAKKRGWGMWVFSGGCASVYGHCTLEECPMRRHFLRHAPQKHLRELAQQERRHA